MKKRSIISIVLLMAVTGLIFSTLYSCTAKPQKNLGLQLYSIRDSIMKDVPAAIAKVGKMGYKFVEPAGYDNGKLYGMAPAAFKALCLSNGLTILSSHVGQALPDSAGWGKTMAWWDTCIDAHVAAGAKFLIQPFMGDGAYRSLDTLKRYCAYFNAIGEKCKAKGIKLPLEIFDASTPAVYLCKNPPNEKLNTKNPKSNAQGEEHAPESLNDIIKQRKASRTNNKQLRKEDINQR